MQRISFFRTLVAFALVAGLVVLPQADAATPDPIKKLTITPVGNQMAFAKTEITVQPGQRLQITFDNTASSPAMQHNLVVLNSSAEDVVRRVGQAALSAENYVPDDPAIIAATDVAKPGEATSVTFTAPDTPGKYTYVCTYPGHYVQMQGTMIVTE